MWVALCRLFADVMDAAPGADTCHPISQEAKAFAAEEARAAREAQQRELAAQQACEALIVGSGGAAGTRLL